MRRQDIRDYSIKGTKIQLWWVLLIRFVRFWNYFRGQIVSWLSPSSSAPRQYSSLILLSACRRLKRERSELRDRVYLQFEPKRIQKMTKRQPNEQRDQKPNLFELCRVASEEEVFNPQLLILLTVGIYRTHLYIDVRLVAHGQVSVLRKSLILLVA